MKYLPWFPDLRARWNIPEKMDDPSLSKPEMERALRFLGELNRLLKVDRPAVRFLEELRRRNPAKKEWVLMDGGAGGGDFARELVRWGERHSLSVRVIALEVSDVVLECGRERTRDLADRITWLSGDLTRLPLADRSVDAAFTSLVFHHLTDEQISPALSEMVRVSRGGVFVGDLLRRLRAYWWIRAITTLFGGSVTRYDGPVSVLRSFRPVEIRSWPVPSGVSPRIRTHFGHRFSWSMVL